MNARSATELTAPTRCFFDTNVLVYLFDGAYEKKQSISQQLFEDELIIPVLSTQTLSEFFVVVTRKLNKPLDFDQAKQVVELLSEYEVVSATKSLIHQAMETSKQQQLSYWDSLIVEAAKMGGCSQILTEDLNAGAVIDGLLITNPYASLRD